MNQPRMTPDQLSRAVELQRQGLTHERIASAIGLSRQTVSTHLAIFNKHVLKRINRRAIDRLAAHVMQLEWMIGESASAWLKSREDVVSVKTTTGGKSGGTTETTTKGRAGNPAFLRECREAMAEIRVILGIERQEPGADSDDYIIDLSDPDKDGPPAIEEPGGQGRLAIDQS